MARPRKSSTSARYEAADGSQWKVGRMDLLVAELAVTEETLPRFHAAVSGYERGWMVCRRLFGIVPAAASLSEHPDNLRTWDRPELALALGLTPAALNEEVERVSGVWRAAGSGEVSTVAEPVDLAEQAVDVDGLILQHGFTDIWSGESEKEWFVGRVRNYGKMLAHSMAGPAVRAVILNELEIRRLQARRSQLSKELATEASAVQRESKTKEHAAVGKQQNELEAVYREQQDQLDKIFPWMGQASSGVSLRAIFSEVVRGHQLHYSRSDNRLVDGINGLGEIQILLRKSEQAQDIQYRAGLVTYLNMAKAALWDANWKSVIPDSVFKKLDAGFREAETRISESLHEPIPDLTSDDPARGEYAPIQIPEGEIPAT